MTIDLKPIRNLFEQKIGLNSELMNDDGWMRIVRERMAMCEMEDIRLYFQHLVSSSIEFQEFVELLVVPETWFFRDKTSFEFIGEYFYKEWIVKPKYHPLRILCIPCSSGEEPYFLAMAFLSVHFPVNLLHIDGIDISKKALAKAKTGEYNKNSFRTKDLSFRDRYFTKKETNYLLHPAIREMVHFSFGNLLEPNLLEERFAYDVIFCRNLFIYFHREAQRKGIEILKKKLNPEGIFVVSPAEAEIVRSLGFFPCGPYKANAFQLKKNQEQLSSFHELGLKNQKVVEALSPTVVMEKKKGDISIEEASHLADTGKLADALRMCYKCLKDCNTDPKIYFLIALIELAQGHEKKSQEYFLKTVYLDPNYYEALVYLALIAEEHGEFDQAELFRTRAKKLSKKNDKFLKE